ncbi:MAG: hypothetical protein JNL43_07205 [Flavobacteriales bacterium]|nr:hypothetical protein [Flavobacteriales bacterium]
MTTRRTALTLLLLVAVATGAGREFVFLNLNYSIDHLANHRDVSYAHSVFRAAVEGCSLRALLTLKWAMALLFIGLMLGFSVLTARWLFGDHRYRSAITLGFLAVGFLALVMNLGAGFHPALGSISVKLLHLLQYPVILFFLWAAALLERRTG